MRDPVVMAILSRLAIADATAGRIAAETGLAPEAVLRQLRGLIRNGMVERRGRTVWGALPEYLYRYEPQEGWLKSDELSGLSRQHVDEASALTLRLILDEALGAIRAGTFEARPEYALIRFTHPDDDGRPTTAARIHEELLEEVFEIVRPARDRLSAGAEPIDATVALFLSPVTSAAWSESLGQALEESAISRRLSNRDAVDTVLSLGDPLRIRLIDVLSLAPASAMEVAEMTRIPPARCRAELKRLLDFGAVRVHERRPRRGTSEYVYVAENRRMIVGAEDLRAHPGKPPSMHTRAASTRIFRDAVRALREGQFGPDRADCGIARFPVRVDAAAFAEISKAMERALERLFCLKDEILAQRRSVDQEVRAATSGMLLFEQAPA